MEFKIWTIEVLQDKYFRYTLKETRKINQD